MKMSEAGNAVQPRCASSEAISSYPMICA